MREFESNLEAANKYLKRFSSNITGHYINGEVTVPRLLSFPVGET